MTRRSWMQHLGLFLLPFVYAVGLVVGAVRFLSPLPSKPRQRQVDAGSVDEFEPGGAPKKLVFNERQVFVVHDGQTIRAYDAECTHLACNVVVHDDVKRGFACNCHGARFGRDGAPTEGPTKVPLQEYELGDLSKGKVVVLDRIKSVGA